MSATFTWTDTKLDPQILIYGLR